MSFLTGNTFPLSLIRRPVSITPATLEEYRQRLATEEWASFWGHANTLAAAKAMTGFDLSPRVVRPAVLLNEEFYPTLDGEEYRECWVVSPDYRPGFRPVIEREVQQEEILSWHILRLSWC